MLELSKPAVDIGIVVSDLGAALRFYRDTLGLGYERQMHVPNVGRLAFLRAGHATIKLVQPDTTAAPGAGGGIGAGVTGIRYVTLHVTGLAAIIDRCVAGGYRISMKPRAMGGVCIAAVDDGEGNWVELAEHTNQ